MSAECVSDSCLSCRHVRGGGGGGGEGAGAGAGGGGGGAVLKVPTMPSAEGLTPFSEQLLSSVARHIVLLCAAVATWNLVIEHRTESRIFGGGGFLAPAAAGCETIRRRARAEEYRVSRAGNPCLLRRVSYSL